MGVRKSRIALLTFAICICILLIWRLQDRFLEEPVEEVRPTQFTIGENHLINQVPNYIPLPLPTASPAQNSIRIQAGEQGCPDISTCSA